MDVPWGVGPAMWTAQCDSITLCGGSFTLLEMQPKLAAQCRTWPLPVSVEPSPPSGDIPQHIGTDTIYAPSCGRSPDGYAKLRCPERADDA